MFQTEKLSMWIIQRMQKSDEKSDSIQLMGNCFRSVGTGESDAFKMRCQIKSELFQFKQLFHLTYRAERHRLRDIHGTYTVNFEY